MSAAEVKCPAEFFVREDRRRPRLFLDFFSLALLFLGVIVFSMACYGFFGCFKKENASPSALRQVDHNNSELNVLSRIERMVKLLLNNSEKVEQSTRLPTEASDFLPLFQSKYNPPVRTRLIVRFGFPAESNSFSKEAGIEYHNINKDSSPSIYMGKERPEVSSNAGTWNGGYSKEKSAESKELDNPLPKIHFQTRLSKPDSVNKIFDEVFKEMDKSFLGFPEPFFAPFKPQFRRSSWPFKVVTLKNGQIDQPLKDKASENEQKEVNAIPVSMATRDLVKTEKEEKVSEKKTPESTPQK